MMTFKASLSLLVPVFILACGCDKSDPPDQREVPTPQPALVIPDESATAAIPLASDALTDPNIYIDSVPRGADVFLLPADEKSADGDKLLGKTPLVIAASQCPNRKFWVSMNMDAYISQVEKIPEMADWIKNFKSDRYFNDGPGLGRDYFNFEVAVSRSMISVSGGLIAVGPVYQLDWPSSNRICTLFVPIGEKISLFYPLMPSRGTFPELRGMWHETFQQHYRFSEEQITEAMECMTRCGKYMTRVKDPFKEDMAREYSITVQGGSNDTVVADIGEVRVFPGINDP